jgi:hypothetical protein
VARVETGSRLRTLVGMGTTGLIFGGLVAAWLAYLVPWYLSHRDQSSIDVEHTLNFTDDALLIQSGEEAGPVELADVSTPLLRAALKRELHVRSVRAARRRRRVLVFLLLSVALLGTTTAFGVTSWWTIAPAAAVLLAWLFASRWSSARLYRRLDGELEDIELGDEEATITIALNDGSLAEQEQLFEHSVEISGPVPTMSLWDPIPVAARTYVSRPLAPRTVRTIDLSAPQPMLPLVPVTADDGLETEQKRLPRASGE